MSYRQIIFANGEYYHLFNRSVGDENIFDGAWNINHMLDLMDYYRFRHRIRFSKLKELTKKDRSAYLNEIASKTDPLVELYCYAFMPNHFHIIARQLETNGIRNFVSNIQNGYAKYYNLKKNRHGGVFINPYQATWLEKEGQFVHVTRYVHLNPVTSFIVEFDKLNTVLGSSFMYYSDLNMKPVRLFDEHLHNAFVINRDFVLSMFASQKKYIKFMCDRVDYQRQLKKIEGLLSNEEKLRLTIRRVQG